MKTTVLPTLTAAQTYALHRSDAASRAFDAAYDSFVADADVRWAFGGNIDDADAGVRDSYGFAYDLPDFDDARFDSDDLELAQLIAGY